MTNREALDQLNRFVADTISVSTKTTISLLQTALAVSVAVVALLLALRSDPPIENTLYTGAFLSFVPTAWVGLVGISLLCTATSAISLCAFWVVLVRYTLKIRARRDELLAKIHHGTSCEGDPYAGLDSFSANIPTIFALFAAIAIVLLAILGVLLASLALLCF